MKSLAPKLTKLWPKNENHKNRDLDLDLDPILTKINRLLGLICTNIRAKYLSDSFKIVASRAVTNKQTNKQTDIQTNRQTNILPKTKFSKVMKSLVE